MPIQTELESIDEYAGTVPNREEQDNITLAESTDTFLDYIAKPISGFVTKWNALAVKLNTLVGEMNSTQEEINVSEQNAINSAKEAITASKSITSSAYIGDWDIAKTYELGESISLEDFLYTAKKTTTTKPILQESSSEWLYQGNHINGGLPVNGVIPLNYTSEIYTQIGGIEWLKSGILKRQSDYPLANSIGEKMILEKTVEHRLTGGTWDGTYFWIPKIFSYEISKYDKNFNFIETVYASKAGQFMYGDMVWDGTYFWLGEQWQGGGLQQLDQNFVGTGVYLHVGNNIGYLTILNGFMYVSDRYTIYKIDLSTLETVDTHTIGYAIDGLENNGTNLFVIVGNFADKTVEIKIINPNDYSELHSTFFNAYYSGFTFSKNKDIFISVLGDFSTSIYCFGEKIGIETNIKDPVTNLDIYTRIS